jgi:hypothetical protein
MQLEGCKENSELKKRTNVGCYTLRTRDMYNIGNRREAVRRPALGGHLISTYVERGTAIM